MSGERICSRCGHIIYLSVNGLGECEFCRQMDAENRKTAEMKRQNDLTEAHLKEEKIKSDKELKLREDELRLNQKRDEQDYIFRERQLQIEQEKNDKEYEARLREIEAQEESNRIARERIEEEQREKEIQAWQERCQYLDNLSDFDIKIYFEETANPSEREYIKARYKNCISSEDYLALLKDENRYLAKKKIQNFIRNHSKEESLDYVLNIDWRLFSEVVERDGILKELIAEDSELQQKIASQGSPQYRQQILRMEVTVARFKKMSSIDRQIFFREFVKNKCKGLTFNPNGYEDENGRLFSLLEPMYIEALDSAERKEYLDGRKAAENEFYHEQQKIQEEKEKRRRELEDYKIKIENYQKELNTKWQENEKLIVECNEINERRKNRSLLSDKKKMSKKRSGILGFGMIPLILLLIGIFKVHDQKIVLSAALIIALLLIIVPIRVLFLHLVIKKIEKEEQEDVLIQNTIVEKSKQLVARINELQKLVRKN